MSIRFDSAQQTIDLAVADLLERQKQRGLGFAQRGGYERMWLGQAIHSKYQEEAEANDPTYRREVALRAELELRGWQITLRGRADGVRKAADGGICVEEIKSVRASGLSAPAHELYVHQARLYAWMLGEREDADVTAELILIELGSGFVEREEIEVDPTSIERSVRRRLGELITEHERREVDRVNRRAAAANLSFPYPEYRRGQRQIVDEIEGALKRGDHLLVEAPTGIGKTVAALYPALRTALAEDKRVFVLTAKTLQQEMAVTVLDLLNAEDAFHSLRLRAKAKMCANDEVLCHEEYCPYARDYFAKLHSSEVLETLRGELHTLLPDAIYERARAAEVCPFEVSLELSRKAQVVVCDYNYVFDPYVSLTDFQGDADLDDVILVIDEIHNLVGRGRSYYSPELSAGMAREAAEALRANEGPAARAAALCRDLAQLIEEWTVSTLTDFAPNARAVETGLPVEELLAMRVEFDQAFIDLLEHRRETSTFQAEDPFVDLYFQVLRFLDGLAIAEGAAFSAFVERRRDDTVFRVFCKDPSRFLGALIRRTHSTIGLSATLKPIEFYRDLLGFEPERLEHLSLPTPFPDENRCIVVDSSVATTWKQREANYQPIAERLSAFATAVPGNCLALFPSYNFLDEIARRLDAPGRRVVLQARSTSDRERERILDELRNALLGDVLLLGVAGGVFAEGVDYPGDMLRAVAIVGPCLPAVSLESELLQQYYQEQYERGFQYAFVVPGMTRVVQAAGRLIRSPEDRGVIALLDRRFLATPYLQHLPSDWLPSGKPRDLMGVPAEAATAFFGESPAGVRALEDG